MPAILDEHYNTIEVIQAEPECGEDFCDRCGDCLACYGGDPCWDGGEEASSHRWIVYADQAEAFRDRVGLADPKVDPDPRETSP